MTRPRTTAGFRSDAEILADFVKMLAFKSLLDDLPSTRTGVDRGTRSDRCASNPS